MGSISAEPSSPTAARCGVIWFAFGAKTGSYISYIHPEGSIMTEADDKTLVAQILSSSLSNNSVSPADLPSVIETIKRSFGGGGESLPLGSSDGQGKKWEPAVSVRKSVTPDAVVCLCCGEKFKALKRHLGTEHHLTPAEYRAAFNLKSDHPLVAPNYAAKRSELAKSLGLGRKAGTKAPARKKTGTRRATAKKAAE